MRMSEVLAACLLACVSLVSACSEEVSPPEPDRPTIDASAFTAVLADLVVARIELMPDTAAYETRAQDILRRHEISGDDLRTYVEVHGQNDDVMTRAYARVEARLDSLYPTGQAGQTPPVGEILPDGPAAAPDTVAP